MTKLKYGKVFITKGSILQQLGLTSDSHIELLGINDLDEAIEFLVVTSDENKHEWLIDKPESGIANIRRMKVPIENEEK